MDIASNFIDVGGQFISDHAMIARKLNDVKAFIFDWDGVFNDGRKSLDKGSGFSEVDSMGTNLLRFSHFLRHGQMPLTAVISGEKNDTAFYFCKRECFDYSFSKTPHKIEALNFICRENNLKPSEVAYFFDDVLDLSVAGVCGVRLMVNRKANPLFVDYCERHQLVDYLTGTDGGSHAIREATELLVALNGNFDIVIDHRIKYSSKYQNYLKERTAAKTKFYTVKDNVVDSAEF